VSVRWILLLLPACVVQEIDLRGHRDGSLLPEECDSGHRFAGEQGCVPCRVLGEPLAVCPCGWQYEAAELPYCDTPEAYFRCLPCTGAIETCNAYDAATQTSRDCFLLASCCSQLAADPGSEPCCQESEELRCVVDPSSNPPAARVGCLPAACCSPACDPLTETCDLVVHGEELVCVCNEVIAP
jgi:hypothetical protein